MEFKEGSIYSIYIKLVFLLALWSLVASIFRISLWLFVPAKFIAMFFIFLVFSIIHQGFKHKIIAITVLYIISIPFVPFGLNIVSIIYAIIIGIPVEGIGTGLLFYVFPIYAAVFIISYELSSFFDKYIISLTSNKIAKITMIIVASLILIFLFYSVLITKEKIDIESQKIELSKKISELIEDVSFDKNLSPKEKLVELDTLYYSCMQLSDEKSQSYCIQNVFQHKVSIGSYNKGIEKDPDVPRLICSDLHKELDVVKKYPNPYGSYLIKTTYSECLEELKIES